MTQPDGDIPDSAIASLSAFAAKTQEDWDDDIRGKTTVPYTKFAGGWGGLLSGILGAGNNALNAITQIGTLIWKVGGDLIDDVGDFINAALSNAATALSNSGLSLANLEAALKGAFDAWFGGGGTGSVAEFTYTIEAIKEAVINGATVYGFAFDEVAWVVPAHAEARGLAFGGGQSGGDITGGLHGSLIASVLDLSLVSAVDIQIGTAGNRTYIREAATPPHTGAVLMESPVHGSAGGVTNDMGLLTPTTSLPGNGGSGALIGGSATAGQSSPLAAGGAAGVNGPAGGNGSPGSSVSTGSKVKAGGGGGGGGGAATVAFNGGGWGGSGGYPGGGGGGAGRGTFNGVGGPGAPGQCYLYLK